MDDGSEHALVDGLVLLKIVKHAKDMLPEYAYGQLLGLDFEDRTEITHCFPDISSSGEETADTQEQAENFRMEMLRCLRDVNVDHNTVGWYASTYMNSFVDENTIAVQFRYQSELSSSVMLVYDPMRTSLGTLHIRALRLTPLFMELYKAHRFTQDDLQRERFTEEQIFEEIPIVVHNPAIIQAMLYGWNLDGTLKLKGDFTRLDLSSSAYLEKCVQSLTEAVEDLCSETSRFEIAKRQTTRNRQIMEQQQLQKVGEEAVNEETLRRLVPDPNKLDVLLVANQVQSYCDSITRFAGSSFDKLFAMGSLHQKQ
jgi:translation initiation factor 3 subunit H